MLPKNAYALFTAMRDRQGLLKDPPQPMTAYDKIIGDAIFNTARAAMLDGGPMVKVVAARTGTGKSTASAAVAAAFAAADPTFSCAFVVPSCVAADEAYREVRKILPARLQDQLAVYSTAHRRPRSKVPVSDAELMEKAKRDYMFEPAAFYYADAIEEARIIVVTHKKLEMEGEEVGPVKFWHGRRRDLVFVDEEMATIEVLSAGAEDLKRLWKAIERVDEDHPWIATLKTIEARMDALIAGDRPDGARYVPTEALVSTLEGHLFADASHATIQEAAGMYTAGHLQVCRFIAAAGRGCVFYARQGKMFVAYEMAFPAFPHTVLLDATANLSGYTKVAQGVELEPIPDVNFKNLRAYHIEPPRDVQDTTRLLRRRSSAVAYGDWTKETVLAHTKPGDNVLVDLHKAMFERHEVFTVSTDQKVSQDWSGRNVWLVTWGAGIGLNHWRHVDKVFLFGEFHRPVSFTTGKTLGMTVQKATEETLRPAQRGTTGDFKTIEDGGVVRWLVQMACRGTIRKIDGDGVAAPMELYLTADWGLLMTYWAEMFPGAPGPVPLGVEGALHGDRRTKARTLNVNAMRGRRGLTLLLALAEGPTIASDQVEQVTGIQSKNLAREIGAPSVKQAMVVYNWQFVPGRPGVRSGFAKAATPQSLSTSA